MSDTNTDENEDIILTANITNTSNTHDKEKTFLELNDSMALEKHEQDMSERKDDQNMRKNYANDVFRFLMIWTAFIFLLLLLDGWHLLGFTLSDNLIITVMTGVFVNILGLFVVVMKYLFPKR